MGKIILEKNIKKELINARSYGKFLISTNGVFDILHRGHLEIFKIMKSLNSTTIICINSDASVKILKGKNRPINKQNDRARMLSELKDIDYVVIFNELNPCSILDKIKPDFHVKSVSGYKGLESEIVRKNGGIILLLEDIPELSTTNIIDKIKESLK